MKNKTTKSVNKTNKKDESPTLKLRHDMMFAINDLLNKKGLNTAASAAFLGISRPRMSNLKNKTGPNFSLDSLFNMLNKLGYTFHFNYTAPTATPTQAHMVCTFPKET